MFANTFRKTYISRKYNKDEENNIPQTLLRWQETVLSLFILSQEVASVLPLPIICQSKVIHLYDKQLSDRICQMVLLLTKPFCLEHCTIEATVRHYQLSQHCILISLNGALMNCSIPQPSQRLQLKALQANQKYIPQ